jgi:hypothetical protein
MLEGLLNSLLELANATSQNLAFAHRDDVSVSYGEETITESNLLELRRRHPQAITLSTFGKKAESLIGADWEWHIIGQHWTFRMRVQAKRLQKDNKLKIPHAVKSSGSQQIELLISDAKIHNLMPVYCFYASEDQRGVWIKRASSGQCQEYEYSCLLAKAQKVKSVMPKNLRSIEKDCIPWHYLVSPHRYSKHQWMHQFQDPALISFVVATEAAIGIVDGDIEHELPNDFPTIFDLNSEGRPEFEGIFKTQEVKKSKKMSERQFAERGISRLIEIDVRAFFGE